MLETSKYKPVSYEEQKKKEKKETKELMELLKTLSHDEQNQVKGYITCLRSIRDIQTA